MALDVRNGRRHPRRRSGRPPQADSEETRARSVPTAARFFAVYGFADAAVTAVAKEAGVTTGTLYYYFTSKAVLYEAVAAQARERLNTDLIDPLLAIVTCEPSLEYRLNTLVNVLVHRA